MVHRIATGASSRPPVPAPGDGGIGTRRDVADLSDDSVGAILKRHRQNIPHQAPGASTGPRITPRLGKLPPQVRPEPVELSAAAARVTDGVPPPPTARNGTSFGVLHLADADSAVTPARTRPPADARSVDVFQPVRVADETLSGRLREVRAADSRMREATLASQQAHAEYLDARDRRIAFDAADVPVRTAPTSTEKAWVAGLLNRNRSAWLDHAARDPRLPALVQPPTTKQLMAALEVRAAETGRQPPKDFLRKNDRGQFVVDGLAEVPGTSRPKRSWLRKLMGRPARPRPEPTTMRPDNAFAAMPLPFGTVRPG